MQNTKIFSALSGGDPLTHIMHFRNSHYASRTPPPTPPSIRGTPLPKNPSPDWDQSTFSTLWFLQKQFFSSVHGTINNFCSELCNKSTTQLILHQRYSHSLTPSTCLPGKLSPCFATILRRRGKFLNISTHNSFIPYSSLLRNDLKQGGGVNECEYRWRLAQTIKWSRQRRKV